MTKQTCKTCQHFHQHYHIDAQSYSTVHCGHCVRPRMKHRKPDQTACEFYVPRNTPPSLPDRQGVIHFLSTDLLDYIMHLPLPPEEV